MRAEPLSHPNSAEGNRIDKTELWPNKPKFNPIEIPKIELPKGAVRSGP